MVIWFMGAATGGLSAACTVAGTVVGDAGSMRSTEGDELPPYSE
jgi:hypothetical protein